MDFLLLKSLTQVLAKKKPESAPSLKPPKEWVEKMTKEIREGNPSYSEERVRRTMGDIWYNELTNAKRKEIRERYGKKYGKATSAIEEEEEEAEKLLLELEKAFEGVKDIEPPNPSRVEEWKSDLRTCEKAISELIGHLELI